MLLLLHNIKVLHHIHILELHLWQIKIIGHLIHPHYLNVVLAVTIHSIMIAILAFH